MLSRSLWRSLRVNARRGVGVPETPYRCFSCTVRAQANKSETDRMTHFGFSNVPEADKESMGGCFYFAGCSFKRATILIRFLGQ